ncbi:MAG: PaaI family thioesterase [Nannocystaceae bacterium]|nr:PaaI family thioesterase [bacterium]
MSVPRPAEVTPEEFLAAVAQLGDIYTKSLSVEAVSWGAMTLRLAFSESYLRPGGTISGPAMFALCDAALWGSVWSATGAALMSVTTDMTLHFLRRPGPVDLIAQGRVLKAGRRLCYGEVTLHSDGDPKPVCHATGTYAPARER